MTLPRQILYALALALLLWTWFVAYNEPDPGVHVPPSIHAEWQMPQDEDLTAELQRQAIEIETTRRCFITPNRDPFKEVQGVK